MDWSEIVDNPLLADLPFKIEQDRYGNIVMSPASYRHGYFQGEIVTLLRAFAPGGRAVVECSVQTPSGVKVPDVVWHSDAFIEKHGEQTPLPAAPEICIEVLSPSNSTEEIDEKRRLYFGGGAREVWLCSDAGQMTFYDPSGLIGSSSIASGFPNQLD